MWLSRCASPRARQRGKRARGLSSRCAARGAARGGAAARTRPPAPAASGWPRTAPLACAARAARGLNRMRTHRVVCHALQNISWQTSFFSQFSRTYRYQQYVQLCCTTFLISTSDTGRGGKRASRGECCGALQLREQLAHAHGGGPSWAGRRRGAQRGTCCLPPDRDAPAAQAPRCP